MKNFKRIIAIVMAVVLLIGAIYTCGIAGYMLFLSCEVTDAELKAQSGSPQMRIEADAIYAEVSKARSELYYGGGYDSWFSTSSRVIQVIVLVISIIIIVAVPFYFYSLYCEYKKRHAPIILTEAEIAEIRRRWS